MNKNAIWFRVHVILYFKRLSVVGKSLLGMGMLEYDLYEQQSEVEREWKCTKSAVKSNDIQNKLNHRVALPLCLNKL